MRRKISKSKRKLSEEEEEDDEPVNFRNLLPSLP
jgi:hypothetical protein